MEKMGEQLSQADIQNKIFQILLHHYLENLIHNYERVISDDCEKNICNYSKQTYIQGMKLSKK